MFSVSEALPTKTGKFNLTIDYKTDTSFQKLQIRADHDSIGQIKENDKN